MRYIQIIIFLFISIFSFSQIEINPKVELSLLNGQKLTLNKFTKVDKDAVLEYQYIKKNGKLKNGYSNYENIYMLSINGIDSVFYEPEDELSYNVAEMGDILLGMQTADKDYKQHWWAFAAGAVVAGGALWLPTYGAVKIVIPVAYFAGMIFVKPSKSYVYGKYPDFFGNKNFAYGFQREARKKILVSTSFGMLVGLSLSGAAWGINALISK